MQQAVTENCSLIQYADDTMIFSSHSDAKQAVEKRNTNIKNLTEFFESLGLTINTDKAEFATFCKSNNNPKFNNMRLLVKDQGINISKSMKYLSVFLDQNLTYQIEVKNILRKMAFGMKNFYAIRDFFSNQNTSATSQCLVFSHPH